MKKFKLVLGAALLAGSCYMMLASAQTGQRLQPRRAFHAVPMQQPEGCVLRQQLAVLTCGGSSRIGRARGIGRA
jgi:hypothetical protein